MCIWVTGALTILSATVYFWVWLKHMASYEPQPAPFPTRMDLRRALPNHTYLQYTATPLGRVLINRQPNAPSKVCSFYPWSA